MSKIATQAPTGVFAGSTNIRELRALQRLLQGPVSRKELDRFIGCANAPDVALRLRRAGLPKEGCLKCNKHVTFTNVHGEPCTGGVFYLTDEGLRRVHAWLESQGTGIDALVARAELAE